MSDASVSVVRLPGLRGQWRAESMARRALFGLLGRMQVGSLTIHEGEQTIHFGDHGGAGPHAVANVHDSKAYRHVLTGGSVGSGESYMLGQWSSPALVDVIRLFCANMAVLDSMDAGGSLLRRLGLKIAHALNSNTHKGSRRNISAHYDLGNDFFSLFLDPTMMYSAAVFPDPTATLETASEHKLDLICRQLELGPDDHLLEIGTGWGGMALHAARHYGCRVTTTTLSREQYEYTRKRVSEAGLEDSIEVLCKDYRDLEGRYDKLVSIEMIEAVGYEFYQNYFRKCSTLLQPGGLMVIQAITMADQRYEEAKKSVSSATSSPAAACPPWKSSADILPVTPICRSPICGISRKTTRKPSLAGGSASRQPCHRCASRGSMNCSSVCGNSTSVIARAGSVRG